MRIHQPSFSIYRIAWWLGYVPRRDWWFGSPLVNDAVTKIFFTGINCPRAHGPYIKYRIAASLYGERRELCSQQGCKPLFTNRNLSSTLAVVTFLSYFGRSIMKRHPVDAKKTQSFILSGCVELVFVEWTYADITIRL